jgi:hypothetical protein
LVGLIADPASEAGAQTARPEFLTGTGDGMSPHVKMYDAAGHELGGFMAFSGATGARVASGDVNGDITPDVVVGTGAGVGSQVSVWSLGGAFMGAFSPYGSFAGGVNVGVGDVDGDAVDEIVTAAGAGGGPHVIVWDWANGVATPKYGWYAYEPGFHGGVNLSVFDLVNSGRDDVVTGPGAGGGPHVRVWDLGSGAAVEDAGWMAYEPGFHGGVKVGGGEIDGSRAVVTGAGPGGGPHVRLFSTHGVLNHEFFAFAPSYHGGVNVMLSIAAGGDLGHVITAPATWGGPHVRAFTSSGAELFGFMAYSANPINGVTLAPIPQNGTSNNTNQNGSGSNTGSQ